MLLFVTSSLAILPFARWMGDATEHLAAHFGEGIGGLLNATFGNAAELIIALAALRAGLYDIVKASIAGSIFGNAAELIIALAALRAGLHDIVKASIAGSIIGNVLLVLGGVMLAGGMRYQEQHLTRSRHGRRRRCCCSRQPR